MVTWPVRMTLKPLMRSAERLFILCGIALEPTWPGWKPSVPSSGAGHQPQRGGEARGAGSHLQKRAHHVEIERARVHLAHVVRDFAEAQVRRHATFERHQLGGVASQEVQHVLLRTDGTLDAAQPIAGEQIRHAVVGLEQLFTAVGDALAHGGGLRWHVVRATTDDQGGRLGRAFGKLAEDGGDASLQEDERLPHLHLLDVFGEIAARHPLVDVLVPGERRKLVDARLHVVPRDALARLDAGEVHAVELRLVGEMAASGTSSPRSRCALSTAIHSCRSSTILCSGDHNWAISALA